MAELIITKSPDDFGFLDILFGYLIGISFLMWLAVIYLAFRYHPFASTITTIILIFLYFRYSKFDLNVPNHLVFIQNYLPYWVQIFLLRWLAPVIAITIIFSICIVSTLTVLLSVISIWYLFKKKEIDDDNETENFLNHNHLPLEDKLIAYSNKLQRMRYFPKNAFEVFYSGSFTALFNSIFITLAFAIVLLMSDDWYWYYTPMMFIAIFLYHLLYYATTLDEIRIFNVCFQSLPSSATLFLGLFFFDIPLLYNFIICNAFLIFQMIGLYTGLLKTPINIKLSVSSSSSSGGSSNNNSGNRSGGGGKSGGGGASSDW